MKYVFTIKVTAPIIAAVRDHAREFTKVREPPTNPQKAATVKTFPPNTDNKSGIIPRSARSNIPSAKRRFPMVHHGKPGQVRWVRRSITPARLSKKAAALVTARIVWLWRGIGPALRSLLAYRRSLPNATGRARVFGVRLTLTCGPAKIIHPRRAA